MAMDAPKRKVTARLVPPEQIASTSSQLPAQAHFVRAKISGTARPRSRATSTVSAPPVRAPSNGALRPVASAVVRRSPSPSKMQAYTVPTTLSKAKEHTRHASVSSMVPPVQSSNSAPPTPIAPFRQNGDAFPSASLRVKAKISGLAKNKSTSTTSSGIPPSLSTILCLPSPPARADTVASQDRAAPHMGLESPPQPPALSFVPLPTSPPASNLSFSSHSSTSASSQSYASSVSTAPSHARKDSTTMSTLAEYSPEDEAVCTPPRRVLVARVRPGTRISGPRSSLSGSASFSPGSTGAGDGDMDDVNKHEDDNDGDVREGPRDERAQAVDDERNEAKSNRKIADLEITTRSLLAINASLEAVKVRQARELRDLRRRLRETRLVLPPRAFRKLQEAEAAADEESDEEDEEAEQDEAFTRLRALVEELLDSGRRALAVSCPVLHVRDDGENATADGVGGKSSMGRPEVLGWEGGGKHGVAIGSRVLSPEEAGYWVDEGRGVEQETERERTQDSKRNDTPIGFTREG